MRPQDPIFRTKFSEDIFKQKYAHERCETWSRLSRILIEDVCGGILDYGDINKLIDIHSKMQFIAGGRYLYYAGRPNRFFNNCLMFRSLEDTREDWSNLSWRIQSALMSGAGVGNDYSIYRGKNATLSRTGGVASGPVSCARLINEIGREVMQGGSRRSAIYGSLNWQHADIEAWLHAKDWDHMPIVGAYKANGEQLTIGDAKRHNFNYPAPLDMTNISVNYDNAFLEEVYGLPIEELRGKDLSTLEIKNIPDTFFQNCKMALKMADPGFSFNFFDKERETLRNACSELTSEDDSDVCNLGSLNMSRIDTLEEFREVIRLATRFLVCGTVRADLPFDKVYEVREKNRRLGLGLMGVHEWLLKRGYRYEVVEELHEWLSVYRDESRAAADQVCDELNLSRPKGCRAIAPTGTIGILAGTTTAIEPLFAVAYKRRYLKNGTDWHSQYVIDGTAKIMIDQHGVHPDEIESALDLAADWERRIKFQADVQDYVDHAISSTINLPAWGTPQNNGIKIRPFAETLIRYCHRLRGFTCYPDGARGGQPLTSVTYAEAKSREGEVFREEFVDICEVTGKGGVCGG
jgi:ribonucleoside-diphosphate reductase alpha chain